MFSKKAVRIICLVTVIAMVVPIAIAAVATIVGMS